MDLNVIKIAPTVFAVGKNYEIIVPVKKESLMWVKIGDSCFYDQSNGVLCSADRIHRIYVPAELLNKERKYTLCYRVVIERTPYFPKTEDECCVDIDFYPVPDEGAKAYFLADAHNEEQSLINAAKAFERLYGEIDFLILGGDNINDSGSTENFETIYRLSAAITGGKKPVVNARGNHDLRGIYAEQMERFFPSCQGQLYYTFKLGRIWGIILDCGEDKNDSHPEYGHTVVCHSYRLNETEFIKNVIKNAEDEYLADGIDYKLVVAHVPFFWISSGDFDIERETFSEWCSLLKENIAPDLMISGHWHNLKIVEPDCETPTLGVPCRAIIGSKPYKSDDGTRHFVGTGLIFGDGKITTLFNNDEGETVNI